jgi:glycosyltransferase involved in cell wall biosynthesis/predicted metal-dependent phosphoesterase TrpH
MQGIFVAMSTRGQTRISRADLHCHSTASQVPKLSAPRALGLPECATPPEEVYELAKRRDMDFVTITDHDTISGALEIAERYEDAFVSEELTAWFRGEPQAVHILCFGITPDDHEWLQAHAGDVEEVAEYLSDRRIACALAHPYDPVQAPLSPRHRRRLAELFGVWEVRNGWRARELNVPAAIYVDTHGGTGVGGSDDHAGVDIGRTWTETPEAADWRAFLDHVRAGRTEALGAHGSAAKWAHSAIALAVRTHGRGTASAPPNPAAVLRMLERVMLEGDVRRGAIGSDLGPEDARALLRAWLAAVELDLSEVDLIARMQADDFSHEDLFRSARRLHERKLAAAVVRVFAEAGRGADADPAGAALGLFDACVAAIPYVPSAAFLGRAKTRLTARDYEPVRVALVVDGVGETHGVTRTIEEVRERGVPGFAVEVIGTEADVGRRLSAVAEVEIPFYAGLRIGVPSVPAVVEAIAEGRYDLIHVWSPGPSGVIAALVARTMGLPILGSYHTDLVAYSLAPSGDPRIEAWMAPALGAFYRQCDHVLSPSRAADATLLQLDVPAVRLGRWDRGVDTERFHPSRRDPRHFGDGDRINVLYAGRLTKEKGVDLLADAFLAARGTEPALHLLLAGGGPEEAALRRRLGDAATFLGWQEGEELATTFASSDLFLFCSQTDTFGQVVIEAQASGLPVVAVAAGGPSELIEDGRTGCLVPADPSAIARRVVELAASLAAREQLARGGLASVTSRTWDRSLQLLAGGYRTALTTAGQDAETRRAA